MAKPVVQGGKTYYSIPLASVELRVSRALLRKWIDDGFPLGERMEPLDVVIDRFTKRYLIPQETLDWLKENRFQQVRSGNQSAAHEGNGHRPETSLPTPRIANDDPDP